MNWTWQRMALSVVDAFAAVSAIGGGYAVLVVLALLFELGDLRATAHRLNLA